MLAPFKAMISPSMMAPSTSRSPTAFARSRYSADQSFSVRVQILVLSSSMIMCER